MGKRRKMIDFIQSPRKIHEKLIRFTYRLK